MSENNPAPAEQLSIFNVLSSLEGLVETPADKISHVVVHNVGGVEFPVRIYRSDGEEFEGHCLSGDDVG